MKRKLLERHNRLISFLLAIIGIGGACAFGGCAYGTPVEYGTPHGTFKVQGKITGKDNVNIKGIRVILRNDTAHTNEFGQYKVQTQDFPRDQDFLIEIDDVDDESNGLYNSLDTIVSFIDPKFENPDGTWYAGETSKDLNVQLKQKN